MNSQYNNLQVNIDANGLGRVDVNERGVAALIILCPAGYAAAAGITFGTEYVGNSMGAFEALGITEVNDNAQATLVNYHVSEVYRINPTAELHLVMLVNTATAANVVTALDAMLNANNGRVRQVAIAQNKTFGTALTLGASNLDTFTHTIYPLLVTMLNTKSTTELIDVDNVVLEAMSSVSAATLPVIQTAGIGGVFSSDITILLGGDGGVFNGIAKMGASVGTYLGLKSKAQLHQSIAWADDSFSVADAAAGKFLSIRYSMNNTATDTVYAAQATSNCICTFRRYPLRSGVWINQSFNCAANLSDLDRSELVGVINEGKRITLKVLGKNINKDFEVEDGRLTATEKAIIEGEMRQRLESELGPNVSSIKTVVADPATDKNNNPYPSFLVERILRGGSGIVPKGKAEAITWTIGLQQ